MRKLILSLILAVSTALAAMAQITTSAIDGTVTDSEGKPLQGATIIARHTPSGSEYGVASDRHGAFRIQGMRTGGPYTIEVSFIGYRSAKVEDIHLSLGNTSEMKFTLTSDLALDAVTVTSNAADRFNAAKTGAADNFTAEDIASLPTVSRSIYDVAKLSPVALASKSGGMSFAGANTRYNTFLIDGVANNDMYGLTSNGTNAGLTNANPIPLDAIEQIQVVVAPFDVRQGGFTGGGINAVTKSGTNTFAGSAYAYYNDHNFYGTTPGKDIANRTKLSRQSTQIYGATLGGAIVKDKLFFFVNGEFGLDSYPSTYYPGYAGAALTADEAKRIAARYKALTGYDGGGYGKRDINRTSGSLIARLDWNIDSRNTLSARYNFIDGRMDEYTNSPTEFLFEGAGYTSVSRSHAVSAELNSRINDMLHNELRVGYTFVVDGRDTEENLPYVEVQGVGANGGGTAYIGTDRFANANSLDQHTLTLTDNLTWYKGRHTLTFGTHNEFYHSHVVYVANSLGAYTYNSISDFERDMAAKYQYNYTDQNVTGTKTWGPKFNALQLGFYVQDQWKPSEHFSLTYGLRADIPLIFGGPSVNEEFNAGSIATRHNVRIGDYPRAQILFSPRVGFRWWVDSQHRTLIRGGAGLFTGRVPFVWIVNNYSNTGIEQKGVTLKGTSDSAGNIIESAQSFSKYPAATSLSTLNPSIQALDRKFRYPQVLRANLAIEQSLGEGWHLTLEALYTKTINNVSFSNLSLTESGNKIYAVSPAAANASNTSTYYSVDPKYSAIYYTTNTSKGHSWSATASVRRSFRFGLDIYAAYTYSQTRSLYDAASSSQANNWSRTYSVDSNSPLLSWSIYDVPHRLTAQVSYSRRYARLFGTTVSLVYQMYSGQRYSLCYGESADLNGDLMTGNTLVYIPTKQDLTQMTFADATSAERWNEFIESDPYLRAHRGKFSERNALQTPMEHRLDLHIAQDFYFGAKSGRKLQLSLDVVNFGNLLCRDWGAYHSVKNARLQPVRIVSLTDDGNGNKTPVYQFTGTSIAKDDILSRWHMQLGVRVVF